MTAPKPLSPAAQAVLDAAQAAYWMDDAMCPADADVIAAAALRAVADQVVPTGGRYPQNEYMEGIRDTNQGVRDSILAIAAELDPQGGWMSNIEERAIWPVDTVVKDLVDGRKIVLRQPLYQSDRYEFICDSPHGEENPDYSYICNRQYCRCSS